MHKFHITERTLNEKVLPAFNLVRGKVGDATWFPTYRGKENICAMLIVKQSAPVGFGVLVEIEVNQDAMRSLVEILGGK